MEHLLGNGLETLHSDEYAIAKPFFESFGIYEPILQGVLENKNAGGAVFTDNKNHPSFVLVCTLSMASSPNAYAYLSGELDQNSLKIIVSYLKTLPKISLVVPLDWKFKSFFEELGFNPVERIQLRRPAGSLHLETWKRSLPYTLSRINRENFDQCHWRSLILSCYGNVDHFLAHGLGFCILDQGKVISESYGFIAKGKAEIGVITDKNYRNQNLGTLISAVMLDYCYKNHLEPYWNCDISNPASIAIAKKLGFEEDRQYLFLKWASP